ncbi:MAG: aldehyde dehydrogenase family protein [Planctomycetota bacterium]
MTQIPIIPAYRFGQNYDSLNSKEITTTDGSCVLAKVGCVNAGLIRRDLRKVKKCFTELQQIPVQQMINIMEKAADLFLNAELLISPEKAQSSEDYVKVLSATCGLPHALVRANMLKIVEVMRNMPVILKGLTRGLDLSAIDTGWGKQDGVQVSYYPAATNLGVVLPSNSPGVNSLWLPAVALRIPVLLKPGREDPWTPLRIIQALLAAGCPAEAFGFYPADHEGAGVLLSDCDRVILFGDARTVEQHIGNPRISVHGPGYSKILIGEDQIDNWPDYIELIADSIARNGGRSCINASTVVVPRFGKEIAEALAEQLIKITPKPLESPGAILAGFSNVNIPQAIHEKINAALNEPGAIDVTSEIRSGDRLVQLNGQMYLQPTVVYCQDPAHTLAKTEFLFPFASVVEIAQDKMLDWIGSSLVITAITADAVFEQKLLRSADIQRLNLGSIPTGQVQWDQPHEGNLFEFLYNRRAIQKEQV